MKNFQETEFVIFDVETTGLSAARGDRMVEIAGLKIKNLELVEKFCSLINPGRPVSYSAFMVNGISDEMLEDAPSRNEVLPQFMDFINGACLVAHNMRFDLGFLKHELPMVNQEEGAQMLEESLCLDTMPMARGLLPGLGSYALLSVARAIGVDAKQQHRAMADVMMTSKVFLHLLESASAKGIKDVGSLASLFGSRGESFKKQEQHKIALIQEAIEAAKGLRILYCGVRSIEVTEREVTPLGIVGSGRNRMLAGYCHLRGAKRNFKLERIVYLEALEGNKRLNIN